MAGKKSVKNGSSKNGSGKWAHVSDHGHFLAVLILFVGFSVYGIASFFNSTNDYIDTFYTNVLRETPEVTTEVKVVQSEDNPFSDLSDSHINSEAVIALYYLGIVNGFDDGTFKPDNKINRAEFAKILVEATDLDYAALDSAVLANCFVDVKDLPDHWFAPAVCAAKNRGWINGYAGGNFYPTRNINKAEALKILLTAFDFEIPDNATVTDMPYGDLKSGDWYLGVALVAKEQNIIAGAGLFNAGMELSRAEVAQMIYNTMKAKGLI